MTKNDFVLIGRIVLIVIFASILLGLAPTLISLPSDLGVAAGVLTVLACVMGIALTVITPIFDTGFKAIFDRLPAAAKKE